jgi:hypothetical protein
MHLQVTTGTVVCLARQVCARVLSREAKHEPVTRTS